WHGPEPKVAYPLQQRMLHGSMGGAGMSMAGVFPSPFASLPGNLPSPFNALPGGGNQTVPLPRADLVKATPPAGATTTPMPPGSSRPGGTPRSPRDAATGGGGKGGNDSSEGWPPAAFGPVHIAEQSSHDLIASPAVMASRQQPGVEPLPSVADAAEELTAVVASPYLPPEARADSTGQHSPVMAGEFAFIDEPTPLLGAISLAPEAFPDGLKPAAERPAAPARPGAEANAFTPAPPAPAAPRPTPAPPAPAAPRPTPAPPAPAAAKSAPPAPAATKSAPPPPPATKSAPPPAATKSAPPARPASAKPPAAPGSAPPAAAASPRPSKSAPPARPASAKPPPPQGDAAAGPAPKPFNANLTAKMKWEPGLAPPRHASASDLLAQLFEAMPALQSIGSEREGVEFVLALLGRVVPSRLSFCHVYDAGRREFVVAGARAPSGGQRLVGARTPELDPSIAPALGQKGAFVVPDAGGDARFQGGRWTLGGEPLRSLVAVAVGGEGGRLGLIELGNPSDGVPFGEADARALEYVAEQLAEFLSRLGAAAGAGR
ncbi:MAG TPA: GAF domain-containing protein, partial [Polyangiaceae bacterium]|nr:GAF domain-containing protein [Polyangiaceae bacterium]